MHSAYVEHHNLLQVALSTSSQSPTRQPAGQFQNYFDLAHEEVLEGVGDQFITVTNPLICILHSSDLDHHRTAYLVLLGQSPFFHPSQASRSRASAKLQSALGVLRVLFGHRLSGWHSVMARVVFSQILWLPPLCGGQEEVMQAPFLGNTFAELGRWMKW